jgi:hypothetical protein
LPEVPALLEYGICHWGIHLTKYPIKLATSLDPFRKDWSLAPDFGRISHGFVAQQFVVLLLFRFRVPDLTKKKFTVPVESLHKDGGGKNLIQQRSPMDP